MSIPHFQEPDRRPPLTTRLDEATYSAALDHLVIVCVDLVLTHQNAVLLAKRNYPPRPSWWILGGRMIAGEDPLTAAGRKLREEGSLQIAPQRLQWIGTYSTCFAKRQQPPQDHGSHSLNITYHLELAATEKAQLHLSPTEYQQQEWLALDSIRPFLTSEDVMDQALLQILSDLRGRSHSSTPNHPIDR
jgi:ADP-ribose pyrophosphatase YjhB (NUDIX family)